MTGFDRIKQLLDPGRWPRTEIPSRQILWILTVACFQFIGDCWRRHVRPDLTLDFARAIDSGIATLF